MLLPLFVVFGDFAGTGGLFLGCGSFVQACFVLFLVPGCFDGWASVCYSAATISSVLLYTEGDRVHEVVALENYAYRPVL